MLVIIIPCVNIGDLSMKLVKFVHLLGKYFASVCFVLMGMGNGGLH
ncbi:unnamed protein product [Trichobilharzia regenti]|nr:unnamed protein product [Trichobilharzia regenti]